MAIGVGSRVKWSKAHKDKWAADQKDKADKTRKPFDKEDRSDKVGTVLYDPGVSPPAWAVQWDDGHASVTKASLLDEV